MKISRIRTLVIFISVFFSLSSCRKDKDHPKVLATITTGIPTNLTTTSATLNGTVNADGNDVITEAGFVYSSNVTEPTTADTKLQSTDVEGDFSADLNSLNSGSKYYVRAYAINSVGTAYGDVVDFTTGNAAPLANNVSILGTLEVDKTVTASYSYSDAENDPEGETTFQWYLADDASGSGKAAIDGATEESLLILEEYNGKFLQVTVTPNALSGSTIGAEATSSFMGAVGEATSVTFVYNNQEVTYGIITSTTTQRKWLDRNLGASRIAQSIDDYQAYGDLFQWGRAADGHQLIARTGSNDVDATGTTGITSTVAPYESSASDIPSTAKFIVYPINPGDWRTTPNNNLWQGVSGGNNPCPAGWRIATFDEWIAENLASGADAFTKLKLTYTGMRSRVDGSFSLTNIIGIYWTTTRLEVLSWDNVYVASFMYFDESSFYTDGTDNYGNARATGLACRCIKD